MDPKTFITIHKARQEGMSHLDILESLEAAGVDPVKAMKDYALTPLPDGRLAGQMNPADPAEWLDNDNGGPGDAVTPRGRGHRETR